MLTKSLPFHLLGGIITSGYLSKLVNAPYTITDEQHDLKDGAKQSKEKI